MRTKEKKFDEQQVLSWGEFNVLQTKGKIKNINMIKKIITANIKNEEKKYNYCCRNTS